MMLFLFIVGSLSHQFYHSRTTSHNHVVFIRIFNTNILIISRETEKKRTQDTTIPERAEVPEIKRDVFPVVYT